MRWGERKGRRSQEKYERGSRPKRILLRWVVLLAFAERVGRQVDPLEPIVSFIPEYAAYVLNRLEVGKDGKTSFERARGKKATVVGLEFGEKVLWRRKKR